MRELHYIIRSIFFVFLPNINAIVKGYPSDQVLYYFSLPNNPSGSVEELHKFFSEFQSRVLEKEKILQEVISCDMWKNVILFIVINFVFSLAWCKLFWKRFFFSYCAKHTFTAKHTDVEWKKVYFMIIQLFLLEWSQTTEIVQRSAKA